MGHISTRQRLIPEFVVFHHCSWEIA